MVVHGWQIAAFIVGFAAVLLVDFVLVDRRQREFTPRDAAVWVGIYVSLALGFAALLASQYGSDAASQFLAAYLTEYSLSVDNLFVFLVIMTSFAVPAFAQHRVLLVGVVVALLLRMVLIGVGVTVLQSFEPTFLIFGIFLGYTAYKVARGDSDEEVDIESNFAVRTMNRIFPTHHEYDGVRLTTRIDGARHLTPMAIVMLTVGATDVMFALDSIPAVLGLTSDFLIVVASNAFALMGLRQLFFLLHGLIERLVHLTRGLAVILGFIAIKLLLMGISSTFGVEVPHISTPVSLAVIVVTLAVTTVTSLLSTRRSDALAQSSIEDAD